MANDRLFLVCLHCGESRVILKYYPEDSYCPDPQLVGEFVEKHVLCSPHRGWHLHGDPCFGVLPQSGTGASGGEVAEKVMRAVRGQSPV